MTMLFRTLKANLTTILGAAAAGQYTVVGYQQQTIDAKEVLGLRRRVQVFFDSGDFSKGKAGVASSTQHEITYRVELTVSASAKGDLTVINNPASTDPQRATAIAAFQTAASEADDSLDEFFDLIYQVLMDADNLDIGTSGPPYAVSNRWVSGMRKSSIIPQGEYVILTGSIDYTCQAIENITGAIVTPAGVGPFDQTLDLIGDDNEKTGVTV